MEIYINYSQVPFNYEMCLNEKCPKAETCLRQLVVQIAPADVPCWKIYSPKYLATLKGDCPCYHSSTKVRFAKGFIGLLNGLPYKQMQTVVRRLMDAFGQRTYYRIRKGERLLSPTEQQTFMDILKRSGVSMPQEFDAYIEDYDW